MTISRAQMKDQSFSPAYKLICHTNIKMKMKWNFAFTGQGCQLAARSLKFHALDKLRSIDSGQNGTREDHYQITNNLGSKTRSAILKCLTNTRSQQSVYCWFSHDVTKIQTKKLSILPRFYFHGALEKLKTNFHANFRFKRVLAFVIEYPWISKLLRDAAFTWRPRELSRWLKK